MTQAQEHWADRVATEVLEAGRAPVISTGISPSGEIHIGNLREVVTGDAIFRALGERTEGVRFNYVADNFDPLRRVYPFLDARKYEPWVGRPLSEIPCPCGEHASYADHFLEPFLDSLQKLRIQVDVERADRMYKSGRMNACIVEALRGRDRIAAILEELTGRQTLPDWSPFNPICADCGRITETRVLGFSEEDSTVEYGCGCGSTGQVPMAGGGKLIWRVDWAARWRVLGVTVEPFGKDHSTRGGSYESGVRIVREIFGGEPPFPIPYEWIRLKGRGDMSSSRGNVLSIARMLEVVPPEALRYLVIRRRPLKTINFDPGGPLAQLVDELDDSTARGRDARAVALSQAGGFESVGVPFTHVVVVAQVTGFDAGRATEMLRRTGYPDVHREALERRMAYAREWLESFAPPELRFTVQDTLPASAAGLNETQRAFLGRLADRLDDGLDGAEIHRRIYDLAGEFDGVRPPELFEAIYQSLLGRSRGPRAGWFLSLLGAGFCAARFREAAGGIA